MRLRILAYHAIADLSDDRRLAEYGVPPRLFEEQLDSLLDGGWSFVDLDEVLAALAGEEDLPRKALLLTFDDAYANLLELGGPILAERGLPGVVFVVAGKLGGTNEWDHRIRARPLDLLDADGLRTLIAQGIEVGSHTVSHCQLPEVPEAKLEQEIAGSATMLEQAGLPRPRTFSYPYGEWSPKIAALAKAAGYEASFTVEPGVVTGRSDPHALQRIEVLASDTPRGVRRKLRTAGWPGLLRRLAQ